MSARILLVLPAWMALAAVASAEPLTCNLSAYRAASGLTAAADGTTLTVTWDGERQQELRLRFGLTAATSTIQDAGRAPEGRRLGRHRHQHRPRLPGRHRAAPHQQPADLAAARSGRGAHRRRRSTSSGGSRSGTRRSTCGAPERPRRQPAAGRRRRQPARACRASPRRSRAPMLVPKVTGCEVKTNGAPPRGGVPRRAARRVQRRAAVHGLQGQQPDPAGRRGEDQRAVGGLQVRRRAQGPGRGRARAWRGATSPTTGRTTGFGGAVNEEPGAARARPAASSSPNAAGPDRSPRSRRRTRIFWAREIAINLGYNWYRKDSDATFSFGIRQARGGARRRRTRPTSRCYSARPGTLQRMTVFLYPSAAPAPATSTRRWRSPTATATSRCPATR